MEANMNQMIEQIVKEVVRQIGIQPGAGSQPAHAELAKYIDHTVLYAYTTRETIARFCDEAMPVPFRGRLLQSHPCRLCQKAPCRLQRQGRDGYRLPARREYAGGEGV